MKKFLTVAALAGTTIATTMFATADQASAQRRWGPALGFGIAAGVVTGAMIANSYAAPVRCGWVRQYDAFGNYLGRVQVCNTVPY